MIDHVTLAVRKPSRIISCWYRGVAWGWVVSFQLGVLKVLSTHPDGCASVDAIKRDLVTLASREWSERLRKLAMLAPKIDVFSAGLILRKSDAWQITEAGRAFLQSLESGQAIHFTKDPLQPAAAPLPRRPQRSLDQYRPATSITRRDKLRRARQQAASIS